MGVFSRASVNRAHLPQRLLSAFLALSFGAVLLVVLPAPKAAAAPCDAPVVNEIACENTKTGTPSSEWQISGSGSASIQGFATDISVNRGATIGFKVKATVDHLPARHLPDGLLRRQRRPQGRDGQPTAPNTNQPACQNQASTGRIDCGNWTIRVLGSPERRGVWDLLCSPRRGTQPRATSSLSCATTPALRTCCSRPPTPHGRRTTTTAATACTRQPSWPRYKVSYNRPFDTSAEPPEDFVLNAEYPMVRLLEANGYDVSYTSGIDTDRRGNLITNHKVFLSVGHDEYWSGGNEPTSRRRATLVSIWLFSAATRCSGRPAGRTADRRRESRYRTLVSYKETHANAKIDPNTAWTGTWRDPRFSPPADGGRPENALTGTIFTVNCCTTGMEVAGVTASCGSGATQASRT